jgi:hypothetical protein
VETGQVQATRKLHEYVAFRVPSAANLPAHRTTQDFLALHLAEFTELFFQVVRLACEVGLVKFGTIAVDGTKRKANASRHKAMSYRRMQAAEVELKAQITTPVKRPPIPMRQRRTSQTWTSPSRSSAGKNAWQPLLRPRHGWKSANAKFLPKQNANFKVGVYLRGKPRIYWLRE